MTQLVQSKSPSGEGVIFKKRIEANFGSIPTPFTKEVTAVFAEADAGDGVFYSPAQALAAGVQGGTARVSATGVVSLGIGTTGGATVTPNTVTVDVYVIKGGLDT